MGKTYSFRFNETPEDQSFAGALINGLRNNRASRKNTAINRILGSQKITVEDFVGLTEFPEVQAAIAKSFDLSVMELWGRLKQSPMELNLRTFGELSEC